MDVDGNESERRERERELTPAESAEEPKGEKTLGLEGDPTPEASGAEEAVEGAEAAEAAEPEERGQQPTLEELAAECEGLRAAHAALQAERDQLAALNQELKEAYARLRADFDNFRRRTREEEARRKLEATEDVIRDLLPVVDNMERAVRAARAEDGAAGGSAAEQSIRAGVELILQQLQGLLEKHGVKPAPGVGEPFDPRWHHALANDPPEEAEAAADGGDGGTDSQAADGGSGPSDAPLIVVEEFQRGYLLGDRTIRPGLVRVGTARKSAGADRGRGNGR